MTTKNPHWMQNPNAFYYVVRNKYGQDYFFTQGYVSEELTRKIADHVGVEHKENDIDYQILFNAIQQKYKKIYVTVRYDIHDNPWINEYVARENAKHECDTKQLDAWFNQHK